MEKAPPVDGQNDPDAENEDEEGEEDEMALELEVLKGVLPNPLQVLLVTANLLICTLAQVRLVYSQVCQAPVLSVFLIQGKITQTFQDSG